jgi:hypothetical protein
MVLGRHFQYFDGGNKEAVDEFKEEVEDTAVVEHWSKRELKMINDSTMPRQLGRQWHIRRWRCWWTIEEGAGGQEARAPATIGAAPVEDRKRRRRWWWRWRKRWMCRWR